MTNNYQFIFILEDGSQEHVNAVEEAIKKATGTVDKQDKWGKKTFAYPINKKIAGYYFDWIISVSKDQIKELKKVLNRNNAILRYLLLNTK